MDLVQINNGKAVTSSLQVAEYFGKKHQHVMEKIRTLLAELPSEWGVSNFRQSSYFNVQGKEQPCYEMTKDGFTLLAMGFTGKKAIEFKLNYINAFNTMIEIIQNQGISLQQQFLIADKEFKTATEIASHAGYTLNHVGKKVKPVKKRIRDNLLEKLQIALPFFESKDGAWSR